MPFHTVWSIYIYEAMNTGSFRCITVNDRKCTYKHPESQYYFNSLSVSNKYVVDCAIEALKKLGIDYFQMSAFDLVDITHQWSPWKEAFAIAKLFGSKQEKMSADSIYGSEIKSFKKIAWKNHLC